MLRGILSVTEESESENRYTRRCLRPLYIYILLESMHSVGFEVARGRVRGLSKK